MEGIEIVDTNADNILEYGVCGYKNIKRAGYPEKIEWLKDRFCFRPPRASNPSTLRDIAFGNARVRQMIKQVLSAIKIVDDVRP